MNTRNCIAFSPLRNALLAVACATLIPVAGAQMNGGTQSAPQQAPVSRPDSGIAANNPEANPDEGAGQLMDKSFVHKALEGGLAEVQLGQLALQKSNNPDVKEFAQKMVDDHTKLGDAMKQVAQQMSVKIPDSPSKKDKATIVKLQALSGDEFDKAYIKDMVKDHQEDSKEFKTEAQNATNPNLRQTATAGSQMIDHHLQMIEQIAQKNNVVAMK